MGVQLFACFAVISWSKLLTYRVLLFLFFSVFVGFIVFFDFFVFFLVFGFCQYYLYARSFDHKMTAKHANNCTPRVARSVGICPKP